MIEIKFPADRLDIARALGRALVEIGTDEKHRQFVRETEQARDAFRKNGGPTEVSLAEEVPLGEPAHAVTQEEVHALNDRPAEAAHEDYDAEHTPDPKQPASLFDSAPGGTAGAADGAETSATSPAGASAPTDTKGVPFDAEYCGQAKEPFYGSGKRSGQWKKRKGVDEADYDEWYAGELAKLQAGPASQTQAEVGEDDHQPEPVNSAAAFGSAEQQAPANAPQDTGAFMGWVSEKQAAGLLNQADVLAAYQQYGVQVTDLFPPNDAATIAKNIGLLYGVLSAKAGA